MARTRVMGGWAIAAGVASAVASAAAPAQEAPGRNFGAQNAKLASIRLESREADSGQKIWSGTGFFAKGRSLALTNNHVASEAALHPERARLVAIFADGTEAAATVVMADAALDLAALSIAKAPMARLELRARAPELGEPMAGAGYGLGLEFSLAEGRVAALSRPGAASPRIQVSASTDGGVSGGPTLDAAGRAIGVNVAGAGRGVALSIPAAEADAFLARAEGALRSGASWEGMEPREVRAQYVGQVARAGLAALASAMDRSPQPATLGPWSVWAPSARGDWSCHDLSAGDKRAPEPWQSRAQGFACARGAAPMSIGREEAGSGWAYGAARLDARSEGTWRAWAGWMGGALSDRMEATAGAGSVCHTRAFRYGAGMGRAQVCAEAIKELPGLYTGSVAAWVDDPEGPGALMARLDFDGLSAEGAGKAAAWIRSQVEAPTRGSADKSEEKAASAAKPVAVKKGAR